ncbi:MAG: hypothetical protein ACRDDH_00010 [Cetobacterium sp.]|uniref:hypothetical protein n=1 Tax=Cetobacterium sp. TaxID=2071632 RepID=UPI003EE53395
MQLLRVDNLNEKFMPFELERQNLEKINMIDLFIMENRLKTYLNTFFKTFFKDKKTSSIYSCGNDGVCIYFKIGLRDPSGHELFRKYKLPFIDSLRDIDYIFPPIGHAWRFNFYKKNHVCLYTSCDSDTSIDI